MPIDEQLARWHAYGQINQQAIETVGRVQQRLAVYWGADTSTPQVDVLLLHIAASLGRIGRGGCVSPLYQPMQEEIRQAPMFPQVMAMHLDLLELIPVSIPEAEQSYFLANLYALVREQHQRLLPAKNAVN
ncbi:Uncharacterised protein [Haemophilus pittmaniae]|uniref:PRD domain-containing protein n=1 Tax=Haemophilus pittmaniae TaxID=249188 RepID=A0A377IYT9_9PAST|nr:hypothetical protein [Haemophilus pittmaniae]STO92810.1 Uncharacterised protein [Haemophilus pittmaniae]